MGQIGDCLDKFLPFQKFTTSFSSKAKPIANTKLKIKLITLIATVLRKARRKSKSENKALNFSHAIHICPFFDAGL